MRLSQILCALCALVMISGTETKTAKAAEITLFAAASLAHVLSEATQKFEQKTGITVRASYAASSALARQIEAGAPADLFFSANIKWMEHLQNSALISKQFQDRSLSNQLVLVAPKHLKHVPLASLSAPALKALLGKHGRLAMGDPDHVPLGIYGKKALQNLNLWQSVQHRIARTDNARASLALIEQGETPLGLLYHTDAMLSNKIDHLYAFPKKENPIQYALALTQNAGKDSKDEAKIFFDFLRSDQIKALFTRNGFLYLQR
ncbi:MAG: molybdate ABC transporter substrate-binding protein [Cohaesibacter sp.]|nr:molybdate ABC transporter substrate-binding protein [Cohaesibacter sp.]